MGAGRGKDADMFPWMDKNSPESAGADRGTRGPVNCSARHDAMA